MSLLQEPGDLAQTPVAALLIEALNQRATGVLAVRHDGADSRVFLRDGIPVGAQTFAAFKPLGQVLLAANVIDMETLARSLAEMARSGRPQGEVLVSMGAATREQVARALSEQQAGYLTVVAGVDAGTFSFEAKPVPEWTRDIRIAPLRAIVQALEQPQAATLVASAAEAVGTPIRLAPGYGRLVAAFGWSASEQALVRRLESLTALDAFFRDPGVPEPRARAILAALLLLGLAAGPAAAEEVPAAAVPELAELAGEELVPEEDAEPAAAQPAAAPPAAPPPPGAPAPVRKERDEERQRRQRLLQRAMQNIGLGPLAGKPKPPAADASPAAPAAAPPPAAASPPERELRAALQAMLPRIRDPDLFARLGVPRTATREQVRNAYFQLAKRFHPDRFGAPALADLQRKVQDLFAALNEAYEVLSDDRRRAEHLAASGQAAGTDAAAAAIDFQKAEACLKTRDLKRARGFYEAAVRGDPRPDHLAALAWLLATDGDAEDKARSRQLLGQALRDPRSVRAAFVAGMIARQEGNDAAAERHFRAVLAVEPQHAEAQREMRALEARRARRDRPRD